jgi:hypothetical protein
MGLVSDYVAGIFGCKVIQTQTRQLSVTTTEGPLALSNPNRFELIVLNLGADNAYISTLGQPGPTNGIMIGANGGMWSTTATTDGEMPSLPWFVVSATTNTNLTVIEVLGDGG